MGLSGEAREKSVDQEKGQTQVTRRGKSPPQYSFSCAAQSSIKKGSITYREGSFNENVCDIFTKFIPFIQLQLTVIISIDMKIFYMHHNQNNVDHLLNN